MLQRLQVYWTFNCFITIVQVSNVIFCYVVPCIYIGPLLRLQLCLTSIAVISLAKRCPDFVVVFPAVLLSLNWGMSL